MPNKRKPIFWDTAKIFAFFFKTTNCPWKGEAHLTANAAERLGNILANRYERLFSLVSKGHRYRERVNHYWGGTYCQSSQLILWCTDGDIGRRSQQFVSNSLEGTAHHLGMIISGCIHSVFCRAHQHVPRCETDGPRCRSFRVSLR